MNNLEKMENLNKDTEVEKVNYFENLDIESQDEIKKLFEENEYYNFEEMKEIYNEMRYYDSKLRALSKTDPELYLNATQKIDEKIGNTIDEKTGKRKYSHEDLMSSHMYQILIGSTSYKLIKPFSQKKEIDNKLKEFINSIGKNEQ